MNPKDVKFKRVLSDKELEDIREKFGENVYNFQNCMNEVDALIRECLYLIEEFDALK